MKEPEMFDLEKVYDEEIAPLMERILVICRRVKMPMLASFLYMVEAGDDGEPPIEGYCTSSLLFADEGRSCRTLALTQQVISRGIGDHEALRIVRSSLVVPVATKGDGS